MYPSSTKVTPQRPSILPQQVLSLPQSNQSLTHSSIPAFSGQPDPASHNMPILAKIQRDEKPDSCSCFLSDLRTTNGTVLPTISVVPSPFSIPAQTSHFTVIDLKDAFLSPPDPSSQGIFALTQTNPLSGWPNSWMEWPSSEVLEQSPHFLDQHWLKTSYSFPAPSTLLQYFDNLAAP